MMPPVMWQRGDNYRYLLDRDEEKEEDVISCGQGAVNLVIASWIKNRPVMI